MRTAMHYPARAVLGICLLLASLPAARAACSGFDDCAPASAAVLEQTRGGFTAPSGLELSLGVERIVTINGELASRTSLQLANVQDIGRAHLLSESLAPAILVQNGNANFAFESGALPSLGTFVQNSLNDQTIRTQTIISANINSMALLKDLNFQSSVRDAALGALAVH